MENEVISEVSPVVHSDLSSNQFITESLIQSINEHTQLDKLEQEVNQLLSQLNSKSSLRKRYDTWIKKKHILIRSINTRSGLVIMIKL